MSERGVVVTGAGSGIGAATVRALVEQGYRVVGTVRRPESAERVRESGALPVFLDVTDETAIAPAAAAIAELLGDVPLCGLVNNAGIPCAGPLEMVPLREVRRAFEVNVFGVLAITQALLPALRASRGRIINMSSISGLLGLPFLGPYAATKFALEGMSDSLRREVAPFGVRVVLIEPGSIHTPIWDKVENIDRAFLRGTPYERMVDIVRERALDGGRRGLPPERVANAVCKALRARRPPARMMVVRSRLGAWLRRLPDEWIDALIVRGLRRRNRSVNLP